MQTRPQNSEFRLLNTSLARETALATIGWAVETFGDELCLLTSMQDTVLLDLAMSTDPTIDVVFLDNGYHFPETLQTLERVERHYGISVRQVRSKDPATADPAVGACCDRKPALLDRALQGKAAWLSGIRRDETAQRAGAELVEIDRRGLTKINPIAGWTESDADAYIDARAIPTNPLLYQGYASIGCWPCTTPAGAGRDGRWAGLDRTECGLHL